MSKRVKLVPLLREGADDLERALLAAARHDGPPDSLARSRTLDALRAASRTAVLAGAGAAGWRWLHLLKPAAISWLAVGGLGVAVTLGAGAWLGREGTPSRELPSPHAPTSLVAAPSAQAAAPPLVAPSSRAPAPPVVARAATPPVSSGLPLSAPAPRPSPGRAAAPAPLQGPLQVASTPAPASPAAPVADRESGVTGATAPAPQEAPPPAPSSSLRQEAALLESVRESLAASRVDHALASLDEYDARFASGALEEEAAVLRVEALLAAGRRDEARRITATFERRHPASSYVRRLRSLVDAK